MRRGHTRERKCSLCVMAITTEFSVYSPPELEVRFVKVWWVDFGWALGGHLAALSLPSSAGQGWGENKIAMGQNKAKAKAVWKKRQTKYLSPSSHQQVMSSPLSKE